MICYLGLGSNMGNRSCYLSRAVKELEIYPQISVLRQSEVIETEPYGKTDQDCFLNCVIEIETRFKPEELLRVCQSIEDHLGRVRKEKWGPRTIDIDLLFCENIVINSETLTLPHPEIHLRKFVLDSLIELCPDYVHPKLDKTIKKMHEELLCRTSQL